MRKTFQDIATKFQLHYSFNDDSHYMNAFTKNKCEYEALQIIKEVACILGVTLDIDSEALLEGGLKDIWKIIGKNSNQISIILVLVTIIFSRIPPSNKELEDLQKQEITLSIEEKQLKIEKLKRELKKEIEYIPSEDIEECVKIMNHQVKITKHKSNYYETLLKYNKVKNIGISILNEKNNIIGDEKIIDRKDFHKYVLIDNDLPSEVDDNAIIQIVSPVLEKGDYKWKGIYLNEVISYSMKDAEFKKAVLRKEVTFQSGTFIEVELEKKRRINSMGEIEIQGYSVSTVIRISNSDETIETKQGAALKAKNENHRRQMLLFEDNAD